MRNCAKVVHAMCYLNLLFSNEGIISSRVPWALALKVLPPFVQRFSPEGGGGGVDSNGWSL